MNLLLSEWRLLAVTVALLFVAIVLLLLRFIQPRALYGARHLLIVAEARSLFLRRLAGKRVDPRRLVELIGKDFRHESADADIQIVLTRVSRIRELFRVLNVRRKDLPNGVALPDVSVCVAELSQIIGSMSKRLVSVGEYEYDLVPADVILGTIAARIESERDGGFVFENEGDVEQWFSQYPVSIEQVIEMLIAVVFALSLRDRSRGPRSLGRQGLRIGLRRRPEGGPEAIQRMIEGGEGRRVEFKATLRKNLHTGGSDPAIEFAIVKTIAAFMNTEGGTLLVGIGDDCTPQGYDADILRTEDSVKRFVGSKVRAAMGATMDQLVETTIEIVQDHEIVRIVCRKSHAPVFTKAKDGAESFFVRSDAATIELVGPRDINAYIYKRFGGWQDGS